LQKWRINSIALQGKIDSLEIQKSNHCGSVQDNGEAKILGLNWDTKQDKFYFDFKQLITYVQSLPPTKHSILRATAKLFDPLGFLSPLIIGTKILFQELCKDKLGWDDKLEGSALKCWNQLKVDLSELSQIKVNRCYYDSQHTPTVQQIHGFSDASQRAYAAVVYLRTVYSDGGVSTCLVASKSRVAPMKEHRLELLGATILARLVDSVLPCYQFKPDGLTPTQCCVGLRMRIINNGSSMSSTE